jgi:hypothetical protein
VKTAKTTQALKDAISLYIANPISQPRRGSNAVDIENATAILPALTINLLRVPPGISKLKAKARLKSSSDNPSDSKISVKRARGSIIVYPPVLDIAFNIKRVHCL